MLLGLALAAAIEALTLLFRFGFGMQAAHDTAWLAPYTFGFRDHHGYYGIVLFLISLFTGKGFWRNALLIAAIGCFVSDFVHHFLVLWPLTGHHEFFLKYPGY